MEINVNGGSFAGMRGDLSRAIGETFLRMKETSASTGKVTLTITMALYDEIVEEENGKHRIAKLPLMKHKIKTNVARTMEVAGTADLQGLELETDESGRPVFREFGRQMSMFDDEE